MNAFAQVLSHYTSQHVPAVNVTGGKAAAIAKFDKPKWDVQTEPFHMFKRRVMIWVESHCICCDISAHDACVADCADAMADAWEDTAGCAYADCLHGNILKC